MKTLALILTAAILVGCTAKQSRLREIERVSDLSDSQVQEAKDTCWTIATADYNCAELLPPRIGMSSDEWYDLDKSTSVCRDNQMLSYANCLRGKGVRYSEYSSE